MGDAGGHVNRAKIMAQEMGRHEFLFVGGNRALDLRATGYSVEEVPLASTIYKENSVDILATAVNACKVFVAGRTIVKRLAGVIRQFDPHLIITDYEYFTPLAARSLDRPCVSLDHQHILTCCDYEPPKGHRLNRLMTNGAISAFYSNSSLHLVVSFFKLPPRDPRKTEVFPAILRREVTRYKPEEADHVLVYQTSPTFRRLAPLMRSSSRPFHVYGFGELPSQGNVIYKAPSSQGFLEDLATCRYVITNGGHNVISEALYLKKPVFSFPISYAYEQLINGYFLSELGYGAYCATPTFSDRVLTSFEERLDDYRDSIRVGNYFGNELVAQRLEELIKEGDLTSNEK
jgi:uncharacterized protein (TIGR00661 family)